MNRNDMIKSMKKAMRTIYNEEDKKEFMNTIGNIAKDGLDDYKISCGVLQQIKWYEKYQNLLPKIQFLAFGFTD